MMTFRAIFRIYF